LQTERKLEDCDQICLYEDGKGTHYSLKELALKLPAEKKKTIFCFFFLHLILYIIKYISPKKMDCSAKEFSDPSKMGFVLMESIRAKKLTTKEMTEGFNLEIK
jgi:hypothetical protein